MLLKAKIGAIEISGDTLRLAVVRVGGKWPTLLEVCEEILPPVEPEERHDLLVQTLTAMLDSLKHEPASWLLNVNSGMSIVRNISIPFKGARRVAAAVPFELEPHLAFPIEDLLIDFKTIAEIGGESEVFTVGMRRAQLEPVLAVLDEVGLNVEAVTIDTVALTGLWARSQKRIKGLAAVLHVCEAGLSLAILFNQKLAYYRYLTSTPEQVEEAPHAVAREVQNTIRSFMAKWKGAGEIAALNLTGAEISREGLDAFAQALQLPVERQHLAPKIQGKCALAIDQRPTAWLALAASAGLAADGEFLLDLHRTERTMKPVTPRVLNNLLFSCCLALVVLLGWAVYYFQGIEKLKAEQELLEEAITGISAEIEELQQAGLGEDVDTRLFTGPSLLAILEEISAKTQGTGVTILDVQIAPPNSHLNWLTLKGTATDPGALNKAFEKLKQSKLFKLPNQPDNISSQGNETRFTIKAERLEREQELPE